VLLKAAGGLAEGCDFQPAGSGGTSDDRRDWITAPFQRVDVHNHLATVNAERKVIAIDAVELDRARRLR
jgi:hypothetical protein